MKINVVGTSGSGKSTLAKQLADALNAPCVQLDQLLTGKERRTMCFSLSWQRL
ncbi:shikimate kinase [Vreelandella neptunia]|uniref:AAA family ATPase n=1 Tax=Vreelandella neptunia TaxID=115551 RepID=A0ABZ0YGI4_9GAMM|nr:AAA family ATPase [Halomonas neptunia]MDN3561081.1 AAA family ATPase [Halomonas neptunia]WQH11217.1 AAA family ATPase [Halomonas neptunia]